MENEYAISRRKREGGLGSGESIRAVGTEKFGGIKEHQRGARQRLEGGKSGARGISTEPARCGEKEVRFGAHPTGSD